MWWSKQLHSQAQSVFTTHTVTAGFEPRHWKHDRYNKCLLATTSFKQKAFCTCCCSCVPLFVPDDAVGKIWRGWCRRRRTRRTASATTASQTEKKNIIFYAYIQIEAAYSSWTHEPITKLKYLQLKGGRHCTVFALTTQPAWVQFPAFPNFFRGKIWCCWDLMTASALLIQWTVTEA